MSEAPRKLSHYFTQSRRKGRAGLPLMSVTMHDGLVSREELERDKERKTKSSLNPEEHLLVEPDDIAYNMMRMWQGALGRASVSANVSPAYGVVRPKPTVDPRFATHWFKSEFGLYMLWAYSYGLTNDRLRLYPKDFLQIPVSWPEIAVQREIAEVLDTWDHAIDRADKLITATQIRKSALSSTLLDPALLTESKPGWKRYRLGQLFSERRETLPGAELLSITAHRGIIRRDDSDRKDSSSADKSNYKRICVGDIGYNTMRMWQGVSALSALEGIVSPAYTIVTPREKIEGQFAAQLFKLPQMINIFWRYSQGLVDDTLSLKFRHFAEIQVAIPPHNEQRDIADKLKTLDHQINGLKRFKAHLLSQKRGLMRGLLNGEVNASEGANPLTFGQAEK